MDFVFNFFHGILLFEFSYLFVYFFLKGTWTVDSGLSQIDWLLNNGNSLADGVIIPDHT